MALKTLENIKETFIEKPSKTLKVPTGPRVRKASDEEATYFKGLFFGPSGTGKTRTLVGLLLHGLKIFAIATDIGGEGFSTVILELKRMGRADLLNNLTFVVLNTYEEVDIFVRDPAKIYPSIYKEGFDFLFWDGFSGYQSNHLSDYIGNMELARSEGGKEISDARESGLLFEIQDWGMVKTGTNRPLNKFLQLYNLETGQVWHKIVTCLEGIKSTRIGTGKDAKTVYSDTKEPLLQGISQKSVLPGFDLIINTKVVAGDEDTKREFKYVCAGHDQVVGAKTRGLELPPVMDGDMFKLWAEIATQKGIKKGEISKDFVKKEETQNVGNI